MKTSLSRSLPVTLSLAALALGLIVPAEAYARGRTTTAHGRHGGIYQRQVNHTPDHFSASGSATLPSGRTARREINTHVTDNGRTTSARATGFNGRSASYNSATTRTDNGYTRQVHVAGPQGATGTKQVNVSRQDGATTRVVTRATTPPAP